jgi:hypothetical protein
VISQKYLISGSKRQYHSYFCKSSCLKKNLHRSAIKYTLGGCKTDAVPRIKATHVVVAGHTTIHDGSISLPCNRLFRFVGIDPIGEAPHAGIDLTKFYITTGVIPHGLLECLVEFAIVQEHIWIMKPPVEMSFDMSNGLDHARELLISG